MTHRIVVAGGGYAGLVATARLAHRLRRRNVHITLLNDRRQFVERVRLHEVVAGHRVPPVPITELLDGTGAQLEVGRITGIAPAAHEVRLADRAAVSYDTLVYALGSGLDVTAVPGVAEHALTLTHLDGAERAKVRIAEIAAAGGTVTVVGGGAAGIEAATELAETFPTLQVRMVSQQEPGWWLSERARAHLRSTFARMGIEVHADAAVRAVESGHLELTHARLDTDATLWAAGMRVPALAGDAGLTVDRAGRIRTDATLRSISHPDVYAVGDAAITHTPSGVPVRMGCGTGMPMALRTADGIAARLDGRQATPQRARFYVQNISLGRRDGLIQALHTDDTPRRAILTGRGAAIVKETVVRSTLWSIRHPGFSPQARPRPAESEKTGMGAVSAGQ